VAVKVLGVNGSARTDGWTAAYLRHSLEFASRSGAEISLVHLSMLNLHFCTGSYSENPNLCNLENCTGDRLGDAFTSLVWKMLEADAILFATPVYWYSPSSLLKVLVERMTSLENLGAFMLRGKVGGVLVVGEEEGASQVASNLMLTLSQMGFLFPPVGAAYLIRRWDDERKSEAYDDAAALGANVVRLAGMLDTSWDWIHSWRTLIRKRP